MKVKKSVAGVLFLSAAFSMGAVQAGAAPVCGPTLFPTATELEQPLVCHGTRERPETTLGTQESVKTISEIIFRYLKKNRELGKIVGPQGYGLEALDQAAVESIIETAEEEGVDIRSEDGRINFEGLAPYFCYI